MSNSYKKMERPGGERALRLDSKAKNAGAQAHSFGQRSRVCLRFHVTKIPPKSPEGAGEKKKESLRTIAALRLSGAGNVT